MDNLRSALSQEELDFLLAAMPDGAADPSADDLPEDASAQTSATTGDDGAAEAATDAQKTEEARTGKSREACRDTGGKESGPARETGSRQETDWSREERFFAVLLGRELGHLVRCEVRLAPEGEERMRAGDLLDSLDVPAFFMSMAVEGSFRRALFHCDAVAARALADASLGASDAANMALSRPLSLLDRELVGRCLNRVPDCLALAFALDDCAGDGLGTGPDDIFLTEDGRTVLVVRLVMKVAGRRGHCLLALVPCSS